MSTSPPPSSRVEISREADVREALIAPTITVDHLTHVLPVLLTEDVTIDLVDVDNILDADVETTNALEADSNDMVPRLNVMSILHFTLMCSQRNRPPLQVTPWEVKWLFTNLIFLDPSF